MIDTITYNIPVSMIGAHREGNIIVRSEQPSDIVEGIAMKDLDAVSYVQVLSVRAELLPLINWEPDLPVDLVVRSPEEDLPFLYQCSPLLARHPVRITVPVMPGFAKVVKLAVSLNFAVSLKIMQQPDRALTDEMRLVADSYLHRQMVTQPIEFFHSTFFSFYHNEPLSLWVIQEEDPFLFRYIADDGRETMSGRFAGSEIGDIKRFHEDMHSSPPTADAGCSACAYFQNCLGYFKWPVRDYDCEGMKALFQMLSEEAHQLQRDVQTFHAGKKDGH